jgi:hypothetical protein
MSNIRSQWTKPQLIVLARGTPEESVLLNCKFIGAGPAPGYQDSANQDGCNDTAETNCGACQARPPGS